MVDVVINHFLLYLESSCCFGIFSESSSLIILLPLSARPHKHKRQKEDKKRIRTRQEQEQKRIRRRQDKEEEKEEDKKTRMGILFGKAESAPQPTAHDRAVLDLKHQQDKLKIAQKRVCVFGGIMVMVG